MTEANKRANLADELGRSADSFRAADALVALDLPRDAISRTYYVIFHLVEALLFSRGLQARTHAGVFHVFRVEFIQTAIFDETHNAFLSNLQKLREVADYKSNVVISIDTARDQLALARAFEKLVRDWLAANGWI